MTRSKRPKRWNAARGAMVEKLTQLELRLDQTERKLRDTKQKLQAAETQLKQQKVIVKQVTPVAQAIEIAKSEVAREQSNGTKERKYVIDWSKQKF